PVGAQDFALVVSGGLSDGYGTVTLDRYSYTKNDIINIRVEDTNLAAASTTVTITSGSGDSETVTLDVTGAGTRIFTNPISTEFGLIVVEDGILQVSDGDDVEATYSDLNPVHDSYAYGFIQTFGPIITNVRVEDIMGTAATVKWDTDIPSNNTVFFGTGPDSGLWTDVQGNDVYTTTHTLILTGLTMETLYYFDVASSTIRGATSKDDYGGDHYTFSTIGPATGALVLLVDDDDGTVSPLDGTPYNEDWENMLDAYGWTYTRWDIATMGTPTQADMEQCKVVMWAVAEGYPQIGAADRDVLDDYLEFSPDPKLYVVGQDVGWDMSAAGTDPDPTWYELHLHAIYERDDADGGGGNEAGDFRVMGLSGDPISAGYLHSDGNCIPLSDAVFGGGRFWPDDITNNGGTITWEYTANAGGGDCGGVRADEAQSAAHTGYPGYRMVYEAWTHEMMGIYNPPAIDPIRSDIMDKTLIWLLEGDHPSVALTYPVGGESLSGTPTITWTSAGSLNTKVFYSPNNGQAWNLLYEDPTGTATSYPWDTTTVDDSTTYKVKVLVTGVMDLTDFDTSGTFSISNGVDTTGPAVVGGSIQVDPQPTYSPAPATLAATITDIGLGDSDIAGAEYFIDTIGADGTGTAMSAALPPWDNSVEDVTATLNSVVADGYYTIYVHGQDAANNWGGYSSCVWRVVNPDPPPAVMVDYPTAANLIEIDGTVDITWTITDNDPWPNGGFVVNITYSADGGASWNPIADLQDVTLGGYSWDVSRPPPPDDGVNYLVRLTAYDAGSQLVSYESDNPFSIDNVYYNPPGMYPDRWYFQAVPPVELSM
ncbi:MAG: hypothetical protein KAX31_02570, partial [Thermoplasmata archaeon]|nr:hypothetical protein [Thermoplasmata archaeon]